MSMDNRHKHGMAEQTDDFRARLEKALGDIIETGTPPEDPETREVILWIGHMAGLLIGESV